MNRTSTCACTLDFQNAQLLADHEAAGENEERRQGMQLPARLVLLHGRLSLKKKRLFERAEESLIGQRIFDSLQVVLRARAYHELSFIALAHGYRQANQVASMPKWPPRSVRLGEDQQALIAIEVIERIVEEGTGFDRLEALPGDDAQVFVQHFHHKAKVLHRVDHRLYRASAVGRIEHATLCSAQFHLTLFREPDLIPRIPLTFMSPFVRCRTAC